MRCGGTTARFPAGRKRSEAMRKPLVALTVLSCFGLAACEDGPTQTFTPAPPNAANLWDDGQTPGSAAPTPGSFQTQSGGTNAMQICNAATEMKTLNSAFNHAITPPTLIGLLDLSGGPTWPGLTIEQAEKIQCQSTNEGDQFGDGTQVNQWGDGGQMWCDYNVSNRLIYFCNAWPGYVGTTTFTSRDGKDTFIVPAVQTAPIKKNGSPYLLDWNLAGFSQNPAFNAEINELYDALTATFASGLPPDLNCQGSGACIAGNFGDVAYMYFPALGVGWWIASLSAGQPTCSTFNRLDQYLTKTLPYSLGNPVLKLDTIGPTAIFGTPAMATPTLGTGPAPCSLTMGISFGDFLSDCVKVDTKAADNTTEYNKLLGGLTHDTETWTFDVQGVDLNFKDLSLGPTDIVLDATVPSNTDVSVVFDVDQSTLGFIANDWVGDDPTTATATQDYHGAGLVYLEFARLVQAGLNALLPAGVPQHQLGAAECLWDGTTGVNPNDPTFPANFPPGCTGFEGFITTAPPSALVASDPPGLANLALGTNALYVNGALQLGLKPGHPAASFCLDAVGNIQIDANGNVLPGSYNLCLGSAGAEGDLMSTSYARILQVMGKGNVANLPADAQDVRFFWKQYVTALVKYMEVAGSANETVAGVHAAPVDADDLFFDSIGAGQFEIGEYVDRRFASLTQAPTDIVFTADVKNGIFDEYTYSRELYRGESAIYAAVMSDPVHDGLGQEHNAELSNIFGSPLLASAWTNVPGINGAAGYSAYYCATTLDPVNCNGQLPPLDSKQNLLLNEEGQPLLARYQAAFAGYATSFTLGQAPQPINVKTTYDDIQQATVTVPLFANYYDPTSAALAPLTTLIPWTPKQPGIGFPVALTGTLDKFIETSNLDFSGTTLSASVDYDTAIDPMTMLPATDGSITFLAVETTDFLGDVFLCQAPNPTNPSQQDLLNVRMYTTVASILDWFEGHPGSYDNCSIIIRYSPYDNYADYITSLINGVRLSITQGGGFGRVVDVTLFVPGQ
jgi:hypothetical protein